MTKHEIDNLIRDYHKAGISENDAQINKILIDVGLKGESKQNDILNTLINTKNHHLENEEIRQYASEKLMELQNQEK